MIMHTLWKAAVNVIGVRMPQYPHIPDNLIYGTLHEPASVRKSLVSYETDQQRMLKLLLRFGLLDSKHPLPRNTQAEY